MKSAMQNWIVNKKPPLIRLTAIKMSIDGFNTKFASMKQQRSRILISNLFHKAKFQAVGWQHTEKPQHPWTENALKELLMDNKDPSPLPA